ncbi:enoyl-CoA hydratase/isomerase family protein [Rhodobacterales bacterium LSUCC0031]|nr:enoyl-CoA hydratase/isomerase family protein [Rhodobacterales bacterium LSUCC0031]
MSDEIDIRIVGLAGRITLCRPAALNALSYPMCLAIEAALDTWADDPKVALIVIDAQGERAFCAGGDIAQMHAAGMQGDYSFGHRFWFDEYRMNAKMFHFPKPVVSFMQGFTMGGGVGVGCHGSHRVVGATSKLALPECGIGLVPDVGSTLLLARAPGRLGEYLGTTGYRMGPGDAIHAGFADYVIPEADWPDLIAELSASGDWEAVDRAAQAVPDSPLAAAQGQIDRLFAGDTIRDVVNLLRVEESARAKDALAAIGRGSPLAVACTLELVHRARLRDTIEHALEQEYRFSYRAMEHGDFLEGIRAAIIDKDKSPKWRHENIDTLPATTVAAMLMPLGRASWSMDAKGYVA